jgi:hypothetical protein
MNTIEQARVNLNFEGFAAEEFSFLQDFGFNLIDSSTTIVRYQKGAIEICVYHGRQSYEIGVEFFYREVRYSISEFIRAVDPELAEHYRNPAACERGIVGRMLSKVSELTKKYCIRLLQGDESIFITLESQRKSWMERYALEVRVKQIRPKANELFRLGEYAKAVELYNSIKACLSPAELKKLSIAERECKN